ncbi:DUF4350 domain-containing protein [Flavisolibacter sp. BT320]|nr:DUF4350 domain-containing protein [Flavisolibacter longurius]
MKKMIPYLAGGLLVLLLFVLLLSSRGKLMQQMDERVTLRQRDSIPYGTSAAKKLLPSLFPNANVYFDARYPGSWDDIESFKPDQAVIMVADYFYADEDELDRISRFAAKGNTVFIIARTFSDDAANYFNLTLGNAYNYLQAENDDSMKLRLEKPLFSEDSLFTYPGKKYEGFIQNMITGRTAVLGRNENGIPNFIRLRNGEGNVFLHTAPLAFSNYFILHKENIRYFQSALSVIPTNSKSVLWNEYFLEKLRSPSKKKDTNWLSTLFNYSAFKWGLLTALATLILFALLGMRRKQRMIPPHTKPRNDSLEFVKTLGRLYYDKGDHKNLAQKMGAYFLEHVRSQYKMPTHTLDSEFVRTLHHKSGFPEEELQVIVSTIGQLSLQEAESEEGLARLHHQLELFYQNT